MSGRLKTTQRKRNPLRTLDKDCRIRLALRKVAECASAFPVLRPVDAGITCPVMQDVLMLGCVPTVRFEGYTTPSLDVREPTSARLFLNTRRSAGWHSLDAEELRVADVVDRLRSGESEPTDYCVESGMTMGLRNSAHGALSTAFGAFRAARAVEVAEAAEAAVAASATSGASALSTRESAHESVAGSTREGTGAATRELDSIVDRRALTDIADTAFVSAKPQGRRRAGVDSVDRNMVIYLNGLPDMPLHDTWEKDITVASRALECYYGRGGLAELWANTSCERDVQFSSLPRWLISYPIIYSSVVSRLLINRRACLMVGCYRFLDHSVKVLQNFISRYLWVHDGPDCDYVARTRRFRLWRLILRMKEDRELYSYMYGLVDVDGVVDEFTWRKPIIEKVIGGFGGCKRMEAAQSDDYVMFNLIKSPWCFESVSHASDPPTNLPEDVLDRYAVASVLACCCSVAFTYFTGMDIFKYAEEGVNFECVSGILPELLPPLSSAAHGSGLHVLPDSLRQDGKITWYEYGNAREELPWAGQTDDCIVLGMFYAVQRARTHTFAATFRSVAWLYNGALTPCSYRARCIVSYCEMLTEFRRNGKREKLHEVFPTLAHFDARRSKIWRDMQDFVVSGYLSLCPSNFFVVMGVPYGQRLPCTEILRFARFTTVLQKVNGVLRDGEVSKDVAVARWRNWTVTFMMRLHELVKQADLTLLPTVVFAEESELAAGVGVGVGVPVAGACAPSPVVSTQASVEQPDTVDHVAAECTYMFV